ncbi:hypothetical protein P4110_03030 [Pseudomonas aeruginosa]|nr:hypothetical protein [Pseudomonas aeruginosa]
MEQRDNVSAAIAECLGVGQTGKGGLGCDELAQVFLVARQLKQLSGQLDSCSPIESGRCAGGRAGVVKRCGRCRGNWVVSLWPVGSPRAGISRYPMRRRCSTPGGGA